MNPKTTLKTAPVILSQAIAKKLLAGVPRLKPESVQALANELIAARLKYPSNAHMTAALTEHVGKVAQAYIDPSASRSPKAEALEVACIAMRIYEEGDLDYGAER